MANENINPMTDVRTFRAESMRDALRIVKATLGPDAVILHTRQIPGKRLLPWQNVPDEVEITAGVGMEGKAANKPQATRSKTHAIDAPHTIPAPHRKPTIAETALPNDNGVDVQIRSQAHSAESEAHPRSSQTPARPTPSVPDPSEPTIAQLAEQIASIQDILSKLNISSPAANAAPKRPQPAKANQTGLLGELCDLLLDRDIPEDIAEEMLVELEAEGGTQSREEALNLLTAMIGRRLTTSGPIQVQPGQRKVVALVGATGVGKTTTIAKLAANYRLRDQVRMGLVTVDTYRIAAVEQLRTYAEIIDLSMKVVTNPIEMRRALDDLAGLDLVLIDTAGRSPRDDLQIQELKRLLSEARVDEVHLLLNMTSNLRSLKASAEKFAFADATSLILTKLDEAMSLGNLLSVTKDSPLPISYLTTGQDVPHDIEPANIDRLARLILGRDNIIR